MKTPRDLYIFWKYFAFPFGLVFAFFLWFISEGAILFGCMFLLLFTAGCARLALGLERLGHEGHGFEFSATGIKEECSFGLVRYHKWDEFKLRSVVFHQGEGEYFYFTVDSLTDGDLQLVSGLHAGPRHTSLHCADYSICVAYTPERYNAFRASCPDIELVRLDTDGSAFYITDSEEEILIARVSSSNKPSMWEEYQIRPLTLKEFQKGIERLAASGFPDVEGILSATGLKLSEDIATKADAAAETEAPAKEAAEEIRASAAREVEEIRASMARELEAIRASAAVFVDEDSEMDEDYEDEFAEDDFEDENFADEDE